VLGAVDHRETAYSPRAFREIYKFIAGREPDRTAITPEAEVRLSGLVTGTPGGVQTNRPVAVASVEIYRVSADGGERIGCALHYPVSLHLQKCYAHLGHKPGDFPVAEKAARECLSLPIYPEMTEAQIQRVAAVIKDFFGKQG